MSGSCKQPYVDFANLNQNPPFCTVLSHSKTHKKLNTSPKPKTQPKSNPTQKRGGYRPQEQQTTPLHDQKTLRNHKPPNPPFQSTADIKESNNYLRVTELTTHGRKINIPPTSHMHQLRQTNRPRNRSHKIPLPQMRRTPNQTRRKMPQIRKTIQMPQMRLHRTIKRGTNRGQRNRHIQNLPRRHRRKLRTPQKRNPSPPTRIFRNLRLRRRTSSLRTQSPPHPNKIPRRQNRHRRRTRNHTQHHQRHKPSPNPHGKKNKQVTLPHAQTFIYHIKLCFNHQTNNRKILNERNPS